MNVNRRIRQRQIHLDFHTPGDVFDVGVDFDGTSFAQTMVSAHVQSVTVFAKCHHGYSYYPSAVGTVHPGLQRDLLGEQIEALHEVGIRAPIYVSVGWDDLAGQHHPEWIATTREGNQLMRPPLTDHSPLRNQIGWSWMDVATGYSDYLQRQVAELCDRYPIDGFFFDIVTPVPNYSPSSQLRMRSEGVDIADQVAVRTYAYQEVAKFMASTSAVIQESFPEATIFYNGTVDPEAEATLVSQTHIEIESLPTGNERWGYLHYPVMSRFASTLKVPMVGMTGRFHKSWADFGGLKRREQLDYEAGTIVATGGSVSIGDQLDARGVLDPAVYRTIGQTFRHLREIEPWTVDCERLVEVAVLGAHRDEASTDSGEFSRGVEAAAQVLLELNIQFDIVDPENFDVLRYSVIVIPDGYDPPHSVVTHVESARAQGSRLILSGLSGWDPATSTFRFDGVPATVERPAPTVPSYIRDTGIREALSEVATDYDYVFYDQAFVVSPTDGATSLGEMKSARYNRTWEHFYSHAQAPVGESLGSPWGVVTDEVLYLAAPLLSGYLNHDYWVYRELFEGAMNRLLPSRVVMYSGPAWVEVTSLRQAPGANHPSRHLYHLTGYSPRRTSAPVPRVDEGSQVAAGSVLSIAPPAGATRAYLAPSGTELSFSSTGGRWEIALPQLGTHTLVVVE